MEKESGNDAILNMFSSGYNVVDYEPNNKANLNINNKQNKQNINNKHRGKQIDDDPFASLDVGSEADLFGISSSSLILKKEEKKEEKKKEKKKEKDSEAISFVDNLLMANPEFGNNDNIFGGNNKNAVDALITSDAPTSHIVDFKKFADIKDTAPIDYDKLTKISDIDQYKVVSIKETVIVDNGDNVKQSVNTQIMVM